MAAPSLLSKQEANRRIENGLAKANDIGVAANIALVDSGGHLLFFVRMDGALVGSVDLAVRKARTSALFRADSGSLGQRSQPGKALWSIENSNGGLVTFGGGIPIFNQDGYCVGAVGVSGGTVEQDEEIARSCAIEGGLS